MNNKALGDFGETTGPRTVEPVKTTFLIRPKFIEAPPLESEGMDFSKIEYYENVEPVEDTEARIFIAPYQENISNKDSLIKTMVDANDSVIDSMNIVGKSPSGNVVAASVKDGILEYKEIKADDSKVFRKKLVFGNNSNQVKYIKERLSTLRYFNGSVNDSFDNMLLDAIQRFQMASGLEATGQIDADTFSLIVGADDKQTNINIQTQNNIKQKQTKTKFILGGLAIGGFLLLNNGK